MPAFVYVHDSKLPASGDLVCIGVWFYLDWEGHVRCRRTAHCNTPSLLSVSLPVSLLLSPSVFVSPSLSLSLYHHGVSEQGEDDCEYCMSSWLCLCCLYGGCQHEQEGFLSLTAPEMVEFDTVGKKALYYTYIGVSHMCFMRDFEGVQVVFGRVYSPGGCWWTLCRQLTCGQLTCRGEVCMGL